MAAARDIILHLGPHKTATTHLQQALRRSRDDLSARGIAVFVPDDLRRNGLRLQDWLGLPGDDPGHEARLRAAFAQPVRRLVMSEENIPGMVPGAGLAAQGLYPLAARRLARLRGVLPPGQVTLALALREGCGFLSSCHSQALMAGRIAPFDAMFGGIDPAALSWVDLAGRLRAAWPGARLVVWNHADWADVGPAVAAELLGDGAPPLRWPRGMSHPGLSGPAVAALLQAAPADPDAARDLARRLRVDLGKEAGHPPHDPWGRETQARAEAALRRQIAELAAQPGVTVIDRGRATVQP